MRTIPRIEEPQHVHGYFAGLILTWACGNLKAQIGTCVKIPHHSSSPARWSAAQVRCLRSERLEEIARVQSWPEKLRLVAYFAVLIQDGVFHLSEQLADKHTVNLWRRSHKNEDRMSLRDRSRALSSSGQGFGWNGWSWGVTVLLQKLHWQLRRTKKDFRRTPISSSIKSRAQWGNSLASASEIRLRYPSDETAQLFA